MVATKSIALVLVGLATVMTPGRAPAQGVPGRVAHGRGLHPGRSKQSAAALSYLAEVQGRRPWLGVTVYDVATDRAALDRLRDLASRSGVSSPSDVCNHGTDRRRVPKRDYDRLQIEGLLTVEVFVRSGCRVPAATPFIQGTRRDTRRCRWSCTTWRSTRTRRRACRRWEGYGNQRRGSRCRPGGRLVTRWKGLEITGGEVEGLFRRPPRGRARGRSHRRRNPICWRPADPGKPGTGPATTTCWMSRPCGGRDRFGAWPVLRAAMQGRRPRPASPVTPAPGKAEAVGRRRRSCRRRQRSEVVRVPWLGRLDVGKLGLPSSRS